jgi:hypothetical protein
VCQTWEEDLPIQVEIWAEAIITREEESHVISTWTDMPPITSMNFGPNAPATEVE